MSSKIQAGIALVSILAAAFACYEIIEYWYPIAD
jgi:hypothetical protein